MKELHPDDIMGVRRFLCKNDLFYLLRYELSTKYGKDLVTGNSMLEHDFVFDRCREFQRDPDGHLDLWARYHFKTTIVTFGYSIQTIIKNPDRTTLILSHNNKQATDKLVQIKRELEENHDFVELFNDVLSHDTKEYQRWSEEKGLVVKRRGNPKECTLASFGLVDAQPTGDHYTDRVYDDVVVPDSVRSDISIRNTTEAWEVSVNLGLYGGVERYVGTRYHYNDTYQTMIDRQAVKVRRYPCFKVDESGSLTEEPQLYPFDYLEGERRKMGPYTWSCQMLLDPSAESSRGFNVAWAKKYTRSPIEERSGRIVYLIGDPAGGAKKDADESAFVVLGLGADKKVRLLDAVYDQINLTKRWYHYKRLHQIWQPLYSIYERLGKDPEVEYFRERMMIEGYVFNIMEVGGNMKKETRIDRLVAPFENGDILLPEKLPYIREDGREIDIVETLINTEMKGYPATGRDHLLDAMSRLYDPKVNLHFPRGDYDPLTGKPRKKDPYLPRENSHGRTWCSI